VPPVRKKTRGEVGRFLARGIDCSDLDRNTPEGGTPNRPTVGIPKTMASSWFHVPAPQAGLKSAITCEGPPVTAIFLSLPWYGYARKRLSGTRSACLRKVSSREPLPCPGSGPSAGFPRQRPLCDHRATGMAKKGRDSWNLKLKLQLRGWSGRLFAEVHKRNFREAGG
jgi:hypothetical protein